MSRRSRVTSALVLATACSTGMLAFQPLAQAASTPHGPLERPGASSDGAGAAAGKDTKAVFDVREGTTRAQRKVRGDRAEALEAAAPVRRLAKALGPQPARRHAH
jgi:extracellular elastinolytic metalloproteinase